METRVALVAIIVEDINATKYVNEVLHEVSEFVIGRMGMPYKKKNINIISVAIDAKEDIINSLSGKLGKINGVSVKVAYSKI